MPSSSWTRSRSSWFKRCHSARSLARSLSTSLSRFRDADATQARLHRTSETETDWAGADLTLVERTDMDGARAEDWKPPAL